MSKPITAEEAIKLTEDFIKEKQAILYAELKKVFEDAVVFGEGTCQISEDGDIQHVPREPT